MSIQATCSFGNNPERNLRQNISIFCNCLLQSRYLWMGIFWLNFDQFRLEIELKVFLKYNTKGRHKNIFLQFFCSKDLKSLLQNNSNQHPVPLTTSDNL